MTTRRNGDPDLQHAVTELQAGVQVEVNSRCVFQRCYPWVRRFFLRLGYTPEDAEDLAQETLGQVLERIGSLRDPDAFKPWLFAAASNLHRNERRRRRREKRKGLEVSIETGGEDGDALPEPAGTEVPPDRAAYDRERREALARAVSELPPQMRLVLVLRVGHGLKYRQVATVLQISVDTVKAHLFQARQRLRAVLGDDLGDWTE